MFINKYSRGQKLCVSSWFSCSSFSCWSASSILLLFILPFLFLLFLCSSSLFLFVLFVFVFFFLPFLSLFFNFTPHFSFSPNLSHLSLPLLLLILYKPSIFSFSPDVLVDSLLSLYNNFLCMSHVEWRNSSSLKKQKSLSNIDGKPIRGLTAVTDTPFSLKPLSSLNSG